MRSLEKENPLVIYGMTKEGNALLFYNYTYGCIVKVDIETKKSSIIWIDQSRTYLNVNMYGGVTMDSDEVIFAPRCSGRILIYNIRQQRAKYIPYNEKTAFEIKVNQFVDAQTYKDYYYFFPGRNDEIIKMNKSTHELSYIGGWAEELGEMPNPSSVKFNTVERINDNICLLPCFQKGLVMEYNMEADNWKIHRVYDDALADLTYDGNFCWIIVKNNRSVLKWEWSPNTSGRIEEYSCPQDYSDLKLGFVHVVNGGKNIFAIPFYGNSIFRLNKQSLTFDTIDFRSDAGCKESLKRFNPSEVNTFCCLQSGEEEAYFYDACCGDIVRLNITNGDVGRISIFLSQHDKKLLHNMWIRLKFDDINYEVDEKGISDFIEYVKIDDREIR